MYCTRINMQKRWWHGLPDRATRSICRLKSKIPNPAQARGPGVLNGSSHSWTALIHTPCAIRHCLIIQCWFSPLLVSQISIHPVLFLLFPNCVMNQIFLKFVLKTNYQIVFLYINSPRTQAKIGMRVLIFLCLWYNTIIQLNLRIFMHVFENTPSLAPPNQVLAIAVSSHIFKWVAVPRAGTRPPQQGKARTTTWTTLSPAGPIVNHWPSQSRVYSSCSYYCFKDRLNSCSTTMLAFSMRDVEFSISWNLELDKILFLWGMPPNPCAFPERWSRMQHAEDCGLHAGTPRKTVRTFSRLRVHHYPPFFFYSFIDV